MCIRDSHYYNEMKRDPNWHMQTVNPVSYTHLDVYKRQEDWSVEEFQNSSNSETLLVSLLSNKNYFDKIFYVNIGNPQERNKDVLFVKEFENMSDNEKDYLRSVNFKISKSCLLYTSRCV